MFGSGSDGYEVTDEFLFIGRTLEEYRSMFAIDVAELARRSVLDCAAGPASFTAEASVVGARAAAVDPMYARPIDELEAECASAVDRTAVQLRDKRHRFEWAFYRGVDARCRLLRAASQRFLADLDRNPGRYVAASLPFLPFAQNAFDLVLSAHFLFLYDDRLSRGFHVATARELARVAASEVRLFPLAALDFEPSAYADDVARELRSDGLRVERVEIPFEFQPGATETLVVSGTGDYDGRPTGRR